MTAPFSASGPERTAAMMAALVATASVVLCFALNKVALN